MNHEVDAADGVDPRIPSLVRPVQFAGFGHDLLHSISCLSTNAMFTLAARQAG